MTKTRPKSALRYPLSGVLSSEARVDVLRELFRHGGELSAPQLVMRTGLAQSSVREALISLEDTRIVEVLGAGRTMLYRANQRHPLRDALENLFAAEEARYEGIANGIRRIISDNFDREVEAVWLFGSVARGQDSFASDLDVVIVGRNLWKADLLDRIRGSLRSLEDSLLFRMSVIGVAPEDLVRLSEENAPLMQSLESDAIPIFGRRLDEFLIRKEQHLGHGT